MQALRGINTRMRDRTEAGVAGNSLPTTPMTATSDVFDALATPAASVAGVVAAAMFAQPSSVALHSAAPSDRCGNLSCKPDVFDYLETPAHAASGAFGAVTMAASGGVSESAATSLDGIRPAAAVNSQRGAARKAGFRLDVNGLADSSCQGAPGTRLLLTIADRGQYRAATLCGLACVLQ